MIQEKIPSGKYQGVPMIELKYSDIANPDFIMAISKLVKSEDIKKADTNLKISRIYKAIAAAEKERIETHQKLHKAFGIQDPEAKERKLFIPHQVQDEFETQIKTLMETKLAIDEDKFKLSDLTPAVKLTPADICGLSPILDV